MAEDKKTRWRLVGMTLGDLGGGAYQNPAGIPDGTGSNKARKAAYGWMMANGIRRARLLLTADMPGSRGEWYRVIKEYILEVR